MLCQLLKKQTLFLSHCRILYGIPVTDDNQEYVHIPLTPQGIPPELAQGTRERAHKPHLQVLGEEVRNFL